MIFAAAIDNFLALQQQRLLCARSGVQLRLQLLRVAHHGRQRMHTLATMKPRSWATR